MPDAHCLAIDETWIDEKAIEFGKIIPSGERLL